jgi:stalled ribosome alternative rescue factor ArfA
MKNTTLQLIVPRQRRRAIELYNPQTPFRGRQERNRKSYQRRDKHQVRQDWF